MDKRACAPVVIITLNRYSHLKECIESLAGNSLARETDLFIALDYPPNEKYFDGFEKTIAVIEAIDTTRFKSVNVVERERNYGALENSRKIQQQVFESYDRLILSEDDNVFSPCFLDYMNQCLDEYLSDESIAFVNGYAYPVPVSCRNEKGIMAHTYLCSAWGIGLWREKEKVIQARLNSGWIFKQFDRAFKDGSLDRMSQNRRCEYTIACMTGLDRGSVSRTSDVSRGIYAALTGCYTLTPAISKVRNTGFDGSGGTCRDIRNPSGAHSQSYSYSKQPVDPSCNYSDGVDMHLDCDLFYKKQLDSFLFVKKSTCILTFILIQIYKFYGARGQSACRKLFKKLPIRGKRIDDAYFN